jgi:phosphatidylglycerol---prolipoprotein diacylglyceryl transferase
MLVHPQFDPVALSLGPIQIHWYGLTYLVAFGLFLALGIRARGSRSTPRPAGRAATSRTCCSGACSAWWSAGGWATRCSTSPGQYLANPLEILMVWKGGMSFHGGLLGVIVAWRCSPALRGRPFLQVMDLVAPCVPTGLASGRIGNFINGELWGRFADPSLPWAMVFPQSGSQLPRDTRRSCTSSCSKGCCCSRCCGGTARPRGARPGLGPFLMGYGVLRFVAEYFREPDSFLGLLALNLSMGQWLCLPMVAAGAALWPGGRGRQSPDAPPEGRRPAALLRPTTDHATDLPRHRNHGPGPRAGRSHRSRSAASKW